MVDEKKTDVKNNWAVALRNAGEMKEVEGELKKKDTCEKREDVAEDDSSECQSWGDSTKGGFELHYDTELKKFADAGGRKGDEIGGYKAGYLVVDSGIDWG